MAYSIPQQKIDEIREATDVVDLVSGYLTLKRRGQNHFGLCPFHNEKTPSFSVNAEKQIFRCFGCGAGGNVFTFLMRQEGVSFPDAVKFLAQRAGIEIEVEEIDAGQAKQNETLYHINEFAAGVFEKKIWEKEGEHALQYIKGRGLSDEIIKEFGLGYAPAGWDGLIREAALTSNDVDALLKAGLVLDKEGGRRYDRFRDRLMFPIWNLSGRVVAFGGRILQDSPDAPKYINSPETAVYEKGKVLYGLYQNRDEIRRLKAAVFVEGYMDFLSLVAAGVRNVVATSGTALTEDQGRLIRRYTKKVIFMYDSDAAGSTATMRGADVLLGAGLDVAVTSLPDGHDPDTYVREFGVQAVRELLENATGLFQNKVEKVARLSFEERGEGIHSLLTSLSKVEDAIQRSVLISEVATKLHVDDKVLWAELEKILHKKSRASVARHETLASKLTDLSRASKRSRLDKAVEDLIRILLHQWQMAEFIFNNIELQELENHPKEEILRYLSNQYKGKRKPTEQELLHHFTEVELSEFIVQELHREWPEVNFTRWATDCVKAIKIEHVQNEINTLRDSIKTRSGGGDAVTKILQQCKELEAVKQHLSSF